MLNISEENSRTCTGQKAITWAADLRHLPSVFKHDTPQNSKQTQALLPQNLSHCRRSKLLHPPVVFLRAIGVAEMAEVVIPP